MKQQNYQLNNNLHVDNLKCKHGRSKDYYIPLLLSSTSSVLHLTCLALIIPKMSSVGTTDPWNRWDSPVDSCCWSRPHCCTVYSKAVSFANQWGGKHYGNSWCKTTFMITSMLTMRSLLFSDENSDAVPWLQLPPANMANAFLHGYPWQCLFRVMTDTVLIHLLLQDDSFQAALLHFCEPHLACINTKTGSQYFYSPYSPFLSAASWE